MTPLFYRRFIGSMPYKFIFYIFWKCILKYYTTLCTYGFPLLSIKQNGNFVLFNYSMCQMYTKIWNFREYSFLDIWVFIYEAAHNFKYTSFVQLLELHSNAGNLYSNCSICQICFYIFLYSKMEPILYYCLNYEYSIF